jgi:hypothetical protein
MNRREALSHIEQIREQLARAEAFWVYRAASVAGTGLLAFVGAVIQFRWGLNDPDRFLTLWISVAIICALIVSVEMLVRCRWSGSTLLRNAAIVAARQFAPCVVAGGLLTVALCLFAAESVHLLPGLWAVLFSLGIFASRPGLPRAIHFAGLYYMLSGLLVIADAHNRPEFAVWPMPVCFGIGQILTAALLYSFTERPYDETA